MKPQQSKKLAPIGLLPKVKELQQKTTLNKYDRMRKENNPNAAPQQNEEVKQEENINNAADFKREESKESLCQKLAIDGYVISFADFFYITHDTIPHYIQPSIKFESELSGGRQRPRKFRQDKNTLIDLKDKLVEIEDLTSNDRYNEAIKRYKDLAEYFISDMDEYHITAYFYKRCISLAKKMRDSNEEALAEMGFAMCNDYFDCSNEAILILEESVKKATDPSTVVVVSKELIKIYKKQAAKFETDAKTFNDDIKMALQFYEKCLIVCENAKQKETEGQIAHKMGQIYFRYKMFDKSIDHQQKYLEISGLLDIDDESKKKNKMEAHAALAQCYMAINDDETAMDHLKQYKKLTEDQGKNDLMNQKADAERHLANLYWKKNDRTNSLTHFNHFFNDAKGDKLNKNRKLVDSARIALGLAKGTHTINDHITMILNSKSSIYDIVEWKFKKDKK